MKTYKCGKCQVTFGTSKQLQFHRESQHFNGFDFKSVKEFKCSKCDKSFDLKGTLNSHLMKVHTEKTQKCDLCDKSFSIQKSLRIHQNLSHFNEHMKNLHYETEYKCKICNDDQSFKFKWDLIAHYDTIHEDMKTYKCSRCNEFFGTSKDLQSHRKILHTWRRQRLSQRKHKCDLCKNSFDSISHLNLHLKNVHGETAYKCDICGQNVNFKRDLIEHYDTKHEDMKTYKCNRSGYV